MDIANATLITGSLFLALLACLEAGRRFGARRRALLPDAEASSGVLDGSIFALLGLMVAFTFGGAALRFDTRRNLIIEQANAIGTAYLRLDLVGPEAQAGLRALFSDYLDTVLEASAPAGSSPVQSTALGRCEELQQQIWQKAVLACKADASPQVTTLLLAAVNEMIDVHTKRVVAARTQPPPTILAMLLLLALVSALLAGTAMAASRSHDWLRMLAFATTMATTVYVILDLDSPRQGIIRIDSYDQVLHETRRAMK